MRILHTADWHLGDRLGSRRIDRTADLRRAVEQVACYCAEAAVDVLLVAGDLFSEQNRADTLCETLGHLLETFLPFLRRGGTILALTGNHENETFCQTLWHTLALAGPAAVELGGLLPSGRFYLSNSPTIFRVADRVGQEVQFVLMPYPTTARYLTAADVYHGSDERNRLLQASYATRLEALRRHRLYRPDLRTILSAHIHVQGTKLRTAFRISERDTILMPADGLAVGWDYVALGHIHEAQSLLGVNHVRYCGSIDRLDMGEKEDAKSVVLFDVGPTGLSAPPTLLPLDATPIYDVRITDPATELPTLADRYPDRERALVRLFVTYRAGRDNRQTIFDELDRVFPRWYERTWKEANALVENRHTSAAHAPQSFRETVTDHLQNQLEGSPDAAALLALADRFLAAEGGA